MKSLNTLAKALKILGLEHSHTVGRTESKAWGETSLYLIQETGLDKLIR